jgi:asparaginyl-tRNA synthetase
MLPVSAASAHPTVYIDEASGSDTQGDGSAASPYATAVGAFAARDTQDLDLLVRKPAPEDALPGSGPEWQPISPTALKKARKLYETQKKKLAKRGEADKKLDGDSEEKRRLDAEKLEQSKSIVLQEPSEPSDKIKIRQAVNMRDRRVRVFGWVHRLRQQGGLIFIVLRDGTGYLQCVLSGRLVRFDSPLRFRQRVLIPGLAGTNLRRPHSDARINYPDHGDHQGPPTGKKGT